MTTYKVSLIRRLPGNPRISRGEWDLDIAVAEPTIDGSTTGDLRQSGDIENNTQYFRGVYSTLDGAIHDVAEFTGRRVWIATDPADADHPVTYEITTDGRSPKKPHPYCTVKMAGGRYANGENLAHE